MCPLRFILVFLSATLAGYFAWKSFRSTPEEVSGELVDNQETSEEPVCSLKKLPSALIFGFWIFVDMASGKYLWRNLRSGGGEIAKKES